MCNLRLFDLAMNFPSLLPVRHVPGLCPHTCFGDRAVRSYRVLGGGMSFGGKTGASRWTEDSALVGVVREV